MEIVKGNENHIAACLSIAKELPQYFTEEGTNTMNKDLRTHQLYTAIDSEEVVGFITVEQNVILSYDESVKSLQLWNCGW